MCVSKKRDSDIRQLLFSPRAGTCYVFHDRFNKYSHAQAKSIYTNVFSSAYLRTPSAF